MYIELSSLEQYHYLRKRSIRTFRSKINVFHEKQYLSKKFHLLIPLSLSWLASMNIILHFHDIVKTILTIVFDRPAIFIL
jgi:hypothetical protein